MKLYNIFYVGYGANSRCYDDTTDDFDVELIIPIIFNKEKK